MSSNKTIKGQLEYRQFIVLEDGTEVRVRYNQNPELYKGTDVQVYAYKATEGKGDNKKEVTKYAVPFEQAIRARKATTKDTIKGLMAQGLTAEEVLAKLVG